MYIVHVLVVMSENFVQSDSPVVEIVMEWIITLYNHYFVVIYSFSTLTSTFKRKPALKVFPRNCCLSYFRTQTEPVDRTYSAGDIQLLARNLAMV